MIQFAHAPVPDPVPDPFDDPDALDELGDEIATLAAHIHAATQRLLELIADFDHRRGWELGGHSSCAHWLAMRTGMELGAAREKVRTPRALAGLPQISASMARGELSFSAVRALTRVATDDNEGDLLDFARGCTTAQIERMVRGWKRGSRQDEADLERERHESRTFSVFPDDEGMYVVKGRLPAEVGALLMRAVEAASDALYREETASRDPDTARAAAQRAEKAAARDPDTARAAARRRADAVGLLAERAMAAGFGGGGQGEADSAPISGTRAARYQVVLHVEPQTLAAEGEPGRSELEDGTRVSAETSRRISCDAAVVRVTRGGHGSVPDGAGSILDVGRRKRTISPALRRALDVRDRGCRFPGCGLRFSDAHHVRHWADGGETKLSNALLVCHHHHRLVHEGAWRVEWWGEGHPVFFDPRGGTHFDGRWKPPELPERPVEALLEENRRRGAAPEGGTAGARWKREADIPDEVYFRALKGLG